MAIDRWTDSSHVHLAAVKALCDQWSTYSGASGELADDPFRPARLPASPTAFDGPLDALPTDGDIYDHAPLLDEASGFGAVPWLAVSITSETDAGQAYDNQQKTVDVTIEVRARYGFDGAGQAARASRVTSRGYALFCARAAQRCIACELASTAADLDPDTGDGNHAFGVFTCEAIGPVVADVSPTLPASGQGSGFFDATATVVIRQMQFRPSGTVGT